MNFKHATMHNLHGLNERSERYCCDFACRHCRGLIHEIPRSILRVYLFARVLRL